VPVCSLLRQRTHVSVNCRVVQGRKRIKLLIVPGTALMMPVMGSAPGVKSEPHNSDIEADVALGRCAPSGPRSLIPVVGQTNHVRVAVAGSMNAR
jgi:hypothetical protein